MTRRVTGWRRLAVHAASSSRLTRIHDRRSIGSRRLNGRSMAVEKASAVGSCWSQARPLRWILRSVVCFCSILGIVVRWSNFAICMCQMNTTHFLDTTNTSAQASRSRRRCISGSEGCLRFVPTRTSPYIERLFEAAGGFVTACASACSPQLVRRVVLRVVSPMPSPGGQLPVGDALRYWSSQLAMRTSACAASANGAERTHECHRPMP